MYLQKLTLTNFRNFSKVDLTFPQTTLLLGNNAQGKSNVLESIYFLATTKSLRAEKDIQLIKDRENFCRVEGEVTEEDSVKLEIFMQKKDGEEGLEKKTKVNGISKRATDYIGNLAVIYFSPEDINLVSGPPALRRWHLDLTLAQIDKQYKLALNQYFSAMTSRNRILKKIKEGLSKIDELDYWTGQMIEAGLVLNNKRSAFFNFINSNKQHNLSGLFQFIYQENLISEERLKEYLAREIAASVSLIGPHRDDFIFKIGDQKLAFFGSRGEQRMAVLELKLAELHYVKKVQNIEPVLVLDDIFSELDEKHRELVASIANKQQTILSAIETENIPTSFLNSAKVINIEKGKIM